VQAVAAVFTVWSAKGLGLLMLAGVEQTLGRDGRSRGVHLYQRGPYAIVRHPIYLGWFLMVWLAPVMNGTRLLFAIVSCFYLVIAVPWEERELRRAFGDLYVNYERRVRWRVLPLIY
jgi:protein-S-isoprenylcysteine O-methyltransferase Ste14